MMQDKQWAFGHGLRSDVVSRLCLSAEKQVKALGGFWFFKCGKSVLNWQAMLAGYEGSVFHVQRMSMSQAAQQKQAKGRAGVQGLSHKQSLERRVALAGAILACLQGFMPLAHGDDKECIDFFTVGESKCGPAQAPVKPGADTPTLLAPAKVSTEEQKVDQFLENYGKPPREFVEFYMNPTPDNAKKWVETYQQIMRKSQNLSDMWSDAERLYGQPGSGVDMRRALPAVGVPAPMNAPASSLPVAPSTQASPLGNFGGLNGVPTAARSEGVMPHDVGLKLTYYYSQVCPYCARMTPELAMLTTNYVGKLEFTCVDVTPFSPSTAPNPTFLRDKLACQWRLPQGDELQREGVVQTPTLLIQQGGKAPVKLSGYMSQEQLKSYLGK